MERLLQNFSDFLVDIFRTIVSPVEFQAGQFSRGIAIILWIGAPV
jgi:hypothetical protein